MQLMPGNWYTSSLMKTSCHQHICIITVISNISPFSNNVGMSHIIDFCMLLITMSINTKLASHCSLPFSTDAIFTPITIFDQISSGPKDLSFTVNKIQPFY